VKWTYDLCKIEALKYKNKSDFKKGIHGSSGAYNRAQKEGWLDSICYHMENPKKKWSYDYLITHLEYNKPNIIPLFTKDEYNNSKGVDLSIKFKDCNHITKTTSNNLKFGKTLCNKCDLIKYNEKQRISFKDLLIDIYSIRKDITILSTSDEYNSQKEKPSRRILRYKCKKGHITESRVNNIKNIDHEICEYCNRINISRSYSSIIKSVGDRSYFSILTTKEDYENDRAYKKENNIKVHCSKCDSIWFPNIGNFVSGSGCPICAAKNFLYGYNEYNYFLPYLKKILENIVIKEQYAVKVNDINYFVDCYLPKYNICIEYDEAHHFKNGKLCKNDKIRQSNIEKKLNCVFIRVNDCDFMKDNTIIKSLLLEYIS
jgi:hypothetical protein